MQAVQTWLPCAMIMKRGYTATAFPARLIDKVPWTRCFSCCMQVRHLSAQTSYDGNNQNVLEAVVSHFMNQAMSLPDAACFPQR